jgi:hypothetical protein
MKFTLVLALVILAVACVESSSTNEKVRKISEEKLEHYRKVLNNKLPPKASKYDAETFQRKLMDKIEKMNVKLAMSANNPPSKEQVKAFLKAKK